MVVLRRVPAGKPESAGAALEKVLEIDPANRTAFERAKELYGQLKDWRAYAPLNDRGLPNLVTDEEKIAPLRAIANVKESKLARNASAFIAISPALPHTTDDKSI